MSDLDETVHALDTVHGARRALGDITMSGLGLTEADLERLRALNAKLTRRSMDLVEVLEEQFEQQEHAERYTRAAQVPVHRVPNRTLVPVLAMNKLPIESKCGPENAAAYPHFVYYRWDNTTSLPFYWCAKCNHALDVPVELAELHRESAVREDGDVTRPWMT